MIKEFKKFVLRGNLIDLAIGFTVGASFTTVARSLVNDIIMPPVGLILGKSDFSDLFITLSKGSGKPPFGTLKTAQEAGAVTLNYGMFLNNLLALLIVAVSMFFLIKLVNNLDDSLEIIKGKRSEKEDKTTPTNKKCPFCYTVINYKATRCPSCTSKLQAPKS